MELKEYPEIAENPDAIPAEAPPADVVQPASVSPAVPSIPTAKVVRNFLKDELLAHKVPLCVLLSIGLFPKILFLLIPMALVWSLCEAVYPKLPLSMRLRANRIFPEKWKESSVFQELSEGIAQMRPFILAAMYVFVAPIAIIWMAGHWLKSLFAPKDDRPKLPAAADPNTVMFLQNVRKTNEEAESNFFHSPAFGITCFATVACGLPAALTFLLYTHLGIDALLGYPSADPKFTTTFAIIGLYIYSVSSCLCVLFLRTWMTFPLNFIGDECRIELNETRIRRHTHSWFSQVVTWNAPWRGRESMEWSEVKTLRYEAPNAIKLYPLPTTIFPEHTFFYNFMNKLAQIADGITQRMNSHEGLYFSNSDDLRTTGSKIKLNLSELDGDERARLFYAVRKWAPHVAIDQRVQDQMLGSSVMQAPRYTQMWFELLTDKMPRRRMGALAPEDKLREGALTVKRRLSSGGQANIYLATQEDGTEVVLKEFILSAADAIGALVESAGEFETESTLLSELTHARIVKMLDFFAEDRRLYLVLERVDGSSLREFVKKSGPLDERKTIELAIQIAEVLEYLHAQAPPVVHRDIAPDNVMFDGESEAKVIDFSLAAAKKSRRTTSTMGKHSYAPPEQLREQPCPQSDIYALGATMYFLLTGSDPKPISVADVKAKRDDISDKLNEIIKHATALDIENRYSDIKWMKLELEALL